MSGYKVVRVGESKVAYSLCPNRSPTIFIPLSEYVQQDYYCCGFIAALTVAEYLIPTIKPKEVLSAIKTVNDYGTTATKMVKGIRELGIKVQHRYDLTTTLLYQCVKIGIPVIISVWPDTWNGDHWCVVRGFSQGRIHLVNHYSLGLSSFKREWIHNYGDGSKTGAGLICTLK